PLFDLAGQHQRVSDHGGHPLDHARPRDAGRPEQSRQRQENCPTVLHGWVGACGALAGCIPPIPTGRGAGVPGGGPPAGAPGMPGSSAPGARPAPPSTTTLARLSSLMVMLLFFLRSSTKASIALDRRSRNSRCWI